MRDPFERLVELIEELYDEAHRARKKIATEWTWTPEDDNDETE